MKLRIYYIGKDKKNFYSDVEDLYLKRIKNYIQIELVQIKPEKYNKRLSAEEIQKIETQKFNKALGEQKNVILLDEVGKTYSSVNFSDFMQKRMNMGGHNISFIIGGAYGFSKEMKTKYKMIVSLSPLTFAHHLARTVLLEQIYRAFTIIHHEPYHNN